MEKIFTDLKGKLRRIIEKTTTKIKEIPLPKKEKEEFKIPVSKPEVSFKLEVKKVPEEKISRIGRSILVKGEISGSEDLHVEGKVEGVIILKDNTLTVGAEGKVKAEILGKKIIINGKVSGNINAIEIITINETGLLEGDIVSPRISIIEGAHFKGNVKMEKPSNSLLPLKKR